MNETELRFLFKKMMAEFLDEHFYDAMREFAWYTGWWPGPGPLEKVDRKDGALVIYSDEPFIEMTEEEIRDLLGIEEEDDDE